VGGDRKTLRALFVRYTANQGRRKQYAGVKSIALLTLQGRGDHRGWSIGSLVSSGDWRKNNAETKPAGRPVFSGSESGKKHFGKERSDLFFFPLSGKFGLRPWCEMRGNDPERPEAETGKTCSIPCPRDHVCGGWPGLSSSKRGNQKSHRASGRRPLRGEGRMGEGPLRLRSSERGKRKRANL